MNTWSGFPINLVCRNKKVGDIASITNKLETERFTQHTVDVDSHSHYSTRLGVYKSKLFRHRDYLAFGYIKKKNISFFR